MSAPVPAERIAVVRALPGLGDLLCAVPALRALRAAHPDAHVTLVGLPAAGWLLERFGDLVDELLAFPGYPGLVEVPFDARRLVAFLAAAHARELDLAVQLHGSGVASNAFAQLLGARRTAGAHLPGLPAPDPELAVAYAEDEHEVRRLLRVVEALGAPARGEHLAFPVTARDEADLAALEEVAELATTPYACVHPGASVAVRRWPAERFAQVADALVQEHGLRVVLTGTAGEAETVRTVAAAMRTQPLDLSGRTSLGALAALLRDAALVVTNDTGTSHLAGALGAPSVVTFVATDPARWAPLDGERHIALGGPAPADPVGPEEVLAAAGRLRAVDAPPRQPGSAWRRVR